MAVSAVSTSVHGSVPAQATTAAVPSCSRSRLTERCEYTSRTRSSRAAGSAPRSTEPANMRQQLGLLGSAPASRARLAAPSTRAATATATSSSTAMVMALSGSEMVKVYRGSAR